MRTDRETDILVDFRNFVKAPKNRRQEALLPPCGFNVTENVVFI